MTPHQVASSLEKLAEFIKLGSGPKMLILTKTLKDILSSVGSRSYLHVYLEKGELKKSDAINVPPEGSVETSPGIFKFEDSWFIEF